MLGLAGAGLLAHASTHAQDSFLRRMMKDRLNFEVRVADADGRPLAGAWIWIVESADTGLKSGTPDLSAVKRMVDRYWMQADFIGEDLPEFVFHRADLQGQYRADREYTSHHASGGYPFIAVASQRGYLPQIVDGTAPLNRSHIVSIVLQRDPKFAPIDPRMRRFDEIMALARNTPPGEAFISEPRMQRLIALERELRDMAQVLERSGKKNEASALYWALADFPEVKHETSEDGTLRVFGYANSRTGQASEADRLLATKLNMKVPKFLIAQQCMARGYPRTGIHNAQEGRAYLDAFYAIQRGDLEKHLTPREYSVAIFQAIGYGTTEEACKLLQQAYRFEPFTMKLKQWWTRIDDIAKRRAQQGLEPLPCEIDGLPIR